MGLTFDWLSTCLTASNGRSMFWSCCSNVPVRRWPEWCATVVVTISNSLGEQHTIKKSHTCPVRDPTVAAAFSAVWFTVIIWLPSCEVSWLTAASWDVSVWSTAVRLLIWPFACIHVWFVCQSPYHRECYVFFFKGGLLCLPCLSECGTGCQKAVGAKWLQTALDY